MEISVTGGKIEPRSSGLNADWGVAAKPKHRGQLSGDGFLVRWLGKSLLFAVVDGAGSGQEAAEAAELCLEELKKATGTNLETIFHDSHLALLRSRGAALALALIQPAEKSLCWAAIGDIDGVLIREANGRETPRESIVKRGGTLGSAFTRPLIQTHSIGREDIIVLTTDGISRTFRDQVRTLDSPEELARRTVADYGWPSDDSLALAIRFGEAA